MELNTKHQTPKSKLQGNTKLQKTKTLPLSRTQVLVFGSYLVFGVCCLVLSFLHRDTFVLLQPLPHQPVQFLPRRSKAHAVGDFAGERVNQHAPRRLRIQAAGAQIKNRLLVQLPDRRAVRALHVIGVNLQLRLRVHGRFIGKEEVLVRLFGVGLLRDLLHKNPAMENAFRFVVENAVEIFMAGAVRLRVLDDHVMVGELFALGQTHARGIKGEFINNGVENPHSNIAGSIAFARSAENDSAGSQFYINFADNTSLDGNYTVFGDMVSGVETLQYLNSEGVCNPQDGAPLTPVTIESITVDTKGIVYAAPTKL